MIKAKVQLGGTMRDCKVPDDIFTRHGPQCVAAAVEAWWRGQDYNGQYNPRPNDRGEWSGLIFVGWVDNGHTQIVLDCSQIGGPW